MTHYLTIDDIEEEETLSRLLTDVLSTDYYEDFKIFNVE
ncbi:hypothetical protein T06_11077 [Trichinella sp. T6]|nr:hypothetical protein T06_11077 [Trichinella sp. T6]